MRTVHVVVPGGWDDPRRPSGGNAYDRRACDGLRSLGWDVHERPVHGGWPEPDARAGRAVADVLGGMPDGAVVVLDGLVASALPDVLVAESARLRLVVLVHLPLGIDVPTGAASGGGSAARCGESRSLGAARAVVVTSRWTRDWLADAYALPADRVVVASPGVDPAAPAVPSPEGARLVCVGAVTPVKGQDLLVDALASLRDLDWSCTVVGSLAVDPPFAGAVRARAAGAGIGARVRFTGPLAGRELCTAFGRADLLVVPSRAETYGMVVGEATARGIPVVATAVGGLPEALGRLPDGRHPGVLVPRGDALALATALRQWLTDEGLRTTMRRAAMARRPHLRAWSETTATVSALLEEVAA
jgi:glycosyltransferase involved in cell wall biosynthesis